MAGYARAHGRGVRHGVAQTYPYNASLDYRFDAREPVRRAQRRNGDPVVHEPGIPGPALLRNWKTESPEMVIDFTRYDSTGAENRRDSSANGADERLNQKGTRPRG